MANYFPTDAERAELEKLSRFMDQNHGREPVGITIKFQHKRFAENTGFASIKIPASSWAMREILQAIKDRSAEILSGEAAEKLRKSTDEKII